MRFYLSHAANNGVFSYVAKEELSRECDYELEEANQKRFCDLVLDSEGFYVSRVVDDFSSRKVLTTELVSGTCETFNYFLN